jgi:CheY-like chemotaxis protein
LPGNFSSFSAIAPVIASCRHLGVESVVGKPRCCAEANRRSSRRALSAELEDAGFEVIEAEDGSRGWSRFCARTPDLVITDMVMPNSDGIELLTRIRARSRVPVVVFTAHGSIDAAVTAFKRGADEFVASSDVEVEELVGLASRLLDGATPADLSSRIAERILGESPAIQRVRERIAGLATLAEPVSICGEPGTGRDTVARALHELGATRGGEFLRVDSSGRTATGRLPEPATVYLDSLDSFSLDAQRYWFERLSAAGRIESPQLRVLASASRPIGSFASRSRCRRSANALRTSPSWPGRSSSGWGSRWAGRVFAWRPRSLVASGRSIGRATSGSSPESSRSWSPSLRRRRSDSVTWWRSSPRSRRASRAFASARAESSARP